MIVREQNLLWAYSIYPAGQNVPRYFFRKGAFFKEPTNKFKRVTRLLKGPNGKNRGLKNIFHYELQVKTV